jgi:hypothetical protein
MKNWKTTLGGIGILLAGIGSGIKLLLVGDIVGATTAIATGIGGLILGFNAADKPADVQADVIPK